MWVNTSAKSCVLYMGGRMRTAVWMCCCLKQVARSTPHFHLLGRPENGVDIFILRKKPSMLVDLTKNDFMNELC